MTKARVNADNASADIQGVTAGTGLTGGGTSGTVTLNLDTTAVIQPTIFDAKADLLTATADNTPARLAVGNNGETLVADSSTSTGLRWQQPKTQNVILNSNMAIWQRGTSRTLTDNAGYCADRWQMRTDGATAQTYSRQATGDTTNLPNIQYCIRAQRDSGQTAARYVILEYSMETADSIALAGQTVTLSFYARRGANFSGASNQLSAFLKSGTGTDQNIGATYTGQVTVASSTPTLTTTWQRFSITGTVATNATELGLQFYYITSGTAGAADYFELTGVQLEVGSVAAPYRTYSATLAGELAACQRYYYRQTSLNNNYENFGFGMSNGTTTAAIIPINLPVTMRTAPTSVDYSTLRLSDFGSGNSVTSLTIDGNHNGRWSAVVNAGVASGLTAYRSYALQSNNSTSGYIGFSAEL